MVRLVVAVSALAIALCGCTKGIAGSAVADEEAAKEATSPLTARQALGDFTSINYCSLLDTPPLPPDIGTIAVSPKHDYEFCLFVVRVSGTEVVVRVGYLDDAETIEDTDRTDDRSKTPPRGLTIQRGQEDDEACVRYLRFTDDIWLTVGAGPDSGKGDWCRVADAAVDSVIRRVIAKQVKHYSFAEKSIGNLDACDLVPADLVNTKTGIKNGKMLRFPTGHSCLWSGRSLTDPVVQLFLGGGESTADDNTKEETLADRRSYVTPFESREGEYSVCDIETDHIDSPDLGDKELVVIEVGLSGKGKDACAPAREVAKAVWPTLPKP